MQATAKMPKSIQPKPFLTTLTEEKVQTTQDKQLVNIITSPLSSKAMVPMDLPPVVENTIHKINLSVLTPPPPIVMQTETPQLIEVFQQDAPVLQEMKIAHMMQQQKLYNKVKNDRKKHNDH
jgi:hypothetical protein